MRVSALDIFGIFKIQTLATQWSEWLKICRPFQNRMWLTVCIATDENTYYNVVKTRAYTNLFISDLFCLSVNLIYNIAYEHYIWITLFHMRKIWKTALISYCRKPRQKPTYQVIFFAEFIWKTSQISYRWKPRQKPTYQDIFFVELNLNCIVYIDHKTFIQLSVYIYMHKWQGILGKHNMP